jgi:hypothetical protein
MALRWVSLAAALAAAAPVSAQQVKEIGIHGTVTLSDPAVAVGGVYGAWRPSSRSRVSLAAGVGESDGETAWRGELLGHFLLAPARKRQPGVYLAGGLAVVGGPTDRGYIVVAVGVENRPGGPSGWFAEAGIGGGARLSAGYRWRWFPSWWRLIP